MGKDGPNASTTDADCKWLGLWEWVKDAPKAHQVGGQRMRQMVCWYHPLDSIKNQLKIYKFEPSYASGMRNMELQRLAKQTPALHKLD